ncbi:MAG: FmdB family zinc ribbon protein [Anaerolineae bacterium]
MPIYEYRCEECGEEFEKFVRSMRGGEEVRCPRCQSAKVQKRISLCGAASSSGARAGLPAASSCSPGGT